MTYNPTITRATLALGLLLTLIGCGRGEPSLVVADRQRALRIVAEASGAFKDAPYKVDWSDFSTMPPLFEALDTGAVDLAASIDNLGLQAAIRGVNLRIVAANRGSPAGDALIVPAGSPIKTVRDLKGHTVIVSTIKGGTADAVFVGALKEAGIPETAVHVGYMAHGDALAAFLAGRIDAWATNDPAYAQAEEGGARLLRNGIGLRKATTYISANTKSIAQTQKRGMIVDFLRRFAKARQWGNTHLDEYSAAYAKATGLPLATARRILARQGQQRFEPIDNQTIKEAQVLAEDQARRGIFPHDIKVAPFFQPTAFNSGS